MFACIHGRSVSKLRLENVVNNASLVDLAFTFSPLVEETTADTVVFDISGQDLLFGKPGTEIDASDAAMASANNLTHEIVHRARKLNLAINVSVAANPDTSIHAARSFRGTTIINIGDEGLRLGALSIKQIDFSLAGIDKQRAEEIQETFSLWGVRTFGDLARLPLAGVAERLGSEGVRLRKLVQGKTERHLNLVRPPIGFEQSLELEHPVEELEPLSFILSRLLNQLCANLIEQALATNELKLRFLTEPGALVSNTDTNSPSENDHRHERTITLPVPMRNPKTLLRLLLFDIEAQPPRAPIISVTISAEPVKPQASQTGLFIPLAPEPEKLEITLARLAKLVGQENVGSPELLDTHRPDAFRLKRFRIAQKRGKSGKSAKSDSRFALNMDKTPALPVMGFRIFRPPWRANVETIKGQPARVSARDQNSYNRVRGKVDCASGPWRSSGDWWRPDVWARDEWDVAVIDSNNQQDKVLCRIYRDLASNEWFVAGIYD